MSDEDKIYRELQQHLDELPIGFPATESGIEIRLLRHFFSPEEAAIAMKLSRRFEPLSVIHERLKETGISIEQLEKYLDRMVSKGGLHVKKNGEKSYANAMLSIGMYEHKVNQFSGEFLGDLGGYFMEEFGREFSRTQIPQLRTIPIEESVSRELNIAPYDELEKIILGSKGPFAVQYCACRTTKELMGDPCKTTSRKETCLTLGTEARMYIDEGWAREVTKEELLDILQQNQADGLVLQPGNYLNPQFWCSCCGCCCGILGRIKFLPKPIDFFATNYHVVIDSSTCTGCEACIERCPTGALSMVESISLVNLDQCIGCGLCVPICSEGSIQLIKNEEEVIPPQTKEDLHDKILAEKIELVQKEKEK
ncbi:MAG: indolepyruvate ferredoxin oxidoreductase subunit alpha [Candidatus Heimdallarchaeota archaeon]